MSNDAIESWAGGERPTVSDLQIKGIAVRYRLTQGQVRGLIALHGTDATRLEVEAERLRRS